MVICGRCDDLGVGGLIVVADWCLWNDYIFLEGLEDEIWKDDGKKNDNYDREDSAC